MNQLIGVKVYHFEELDSTNEYASNLIAKKSPMEGTVVSTGHQINGKGQYGRKWLTKKNKNLTLSVILKPNIKVEDQFSLNIMASLAIKKTLESFIKQSIDVKWPNDIYVNGNKICGILIQNFISGSNINNSIVGIGLNINQKEFDPLAPNPTSMSILSKQDHDLSAVQKLLFNNLNASYHLLQSHPEQMRGPYVRSLLGHQELRMFKINDEIISGTILGIDSFGRLSVLIDDAVRSFTMGEIKMII